MTAPGGGSSPARPVGLLANTAYLFGSRALEAVLRGGYALVLAGWLGPELYGLFSVGMSWYLAFLPLAVWGMTVILLRGLGRSADDAARRHLLDTSLGLRLLTGLLATVLCIALVLLHDAAGRAVSLGFAFALLGRALAMWVNDVLVAGGDARLVLQLQTPLRLLEIAIGVAVLALGGGLWGVLLVHVLSWWLQAGIGLAVARLACGGLEPAYRPRELLPLLRQGVPTTLLGFANGWLLQGILVLAAGALASPDALGQLALAQQVYLLAVTLVGALASTSLPLLSRAVAAGRGEDRVMAERLLKLMVAYAGVAAIVGGALGPVLLDVVLAGRYREAGLLIGPFLWLLALDGLNMAQNQRLLAHGRDRAAMLCSVAGAAALTAVMFPALAAFGLPGAIVAAAGGRLVRVALAAGLLYRPSARPLSAVLPRALLLLALVCGIDQGLRPLLPAAAAVLAPALLAVGWWWLLLNGADRAALLGRLRRARALADA